MADIIFWKANDFRGTLYSKVFEVADYGFDIDFRNLKWRIQYGGHAILETLRYSHNSVLVLRTRGFLGSLITNFTSDFRNSKWRAQYGGHNILGTQRFSWNFVLKGC